MVPPFVVALLSSCLNILQKINFPEMTPRAFVTFKTFSAATVARQVTNDSPSCYFIRC